MTRVRALVAGAALAVLAGGCAGPRIVNSMSTTREGKFRLLYYRNAGMGNSEQGIIDCNAAPNGSISGCQQVKVDFKEES